MSWNTKSIRDQQSQHQQLDAETQTLPSAEAASDVGNQAQVLFSDTPSSGLDGCVETPAPRLSARRTRGVAPDKYVTPTSLQKDKS